MSVSAPHETLGSALLWFWISYGLHIAESLKGDLILVDVLKHLLPIYDGPSVTLYRGELFSRYEMGVYGMSWTTRTKVADTFAKRRSYLGEGPGIVLKIEATPDVIVACLEQTSSGEHTKWIGEYEYILDPRLIRNVCASG